MDACVLIKNVPTEHTHQQEKNDPFKFFHVSSIKKIISKVYDAEEDGNIDMKIFLKVLTKYTLSKMMNIISS